jgi:hypothetical protein
MIGNAESTPSLLDQGEVGIENAKAKPADQQKIMKSLAVRVPPPTKQQLKHQRLQNLQQNLALARRNVQAIKQEMRSLRGAE